MKKRKLNRKFLKTVIPISVATGLLIILIVGFNILTKPKAKKFLEKINTESYIHIDKYAIYGIHMNFEGSFVLPQEVDNLKLVLSNGKTEIDIPWQLVKEEDVYKFKTSEYINEGINLENLPIEELYLLVKTEKDGKNDYYSVENHTDYQDLEYYTLTKNNKNNKIDIEWNTYEECPTLRFHIYETTLPENVYDITIDPGHDATDPGKTVCENAYNDNYGVCPSGPVYKEADMNLYLSLIIKEKLENLGYKVTMTRDSEDDIVHIYDPMGSATMANDTKSKFNFAIHHNSSGINGGTEEQRGLEVYIANDTNPDFAETFVQEITSSANTTISQKAKYRVGDGIYQRFFTQEEIDNDEYKAYKSTNLIWYYYLREVGGISTHAIYNGYDQVNFPHPNDHYNSNNTAESYLFELGYMDNINDLNNIIGNKEGYANGFINALQKYLEQEK